MTYNEFLNAVKREVELQLGEARIVNLHQVTKNNGVVLDALYFESLEKPYSPNIYLAPYFDEYNSGVKLEQIVQNIIARAKAYEEDAELEACIVLFQDFEKLKNHITIRLVNYEKNKELLQNAPYQDFLDFAITYRIMVKQDEEGVYSTLITNELWEKWNISLAVLHETAMNNMTKDFPSKVCKLSDLLSGMAGTEENFPDDSDIYILTNSIGINGASCICYPGILKDFSKEHQCDLYLMPCSIHEWILMPASDDKNAEHLQEIVTHANNTVVSKEEYLSGHVYYYSREENAIKTLI
ncbi:MAG: DUF5688 family protein [Lachnospiraceae bacterium]